MIGLPFNTRSQGDSTYHDQGYFCKDRNIIHKVIHGECAYFSNPLNPYSYFKSWEKSLLLELTETSLEWCGTGRTHPCLWCRATGTDTWRHRRPVRCASSRHGAAHPHPILQLRASRWHIHKTHVSHRPIGWPIRKAERKKRVRKNNPPWKLQYLGESLDLNKILDYWGDILTHSCRISTYETSR